MAARDVRHEFLARTALRLGIRSIALAHHADDQVELFFLRLFRGSGADGLGGMRWRGRSPSHRDVVIVRPLLDLQKTDLRAWAKDEGVRYREDASNASRDIERNRIRHELLPLLRRRFQPALQRTVARVMDMARMDSECLNALAERFLDSKRKSFSRLPVALQRRCIQLQLQRSNIRAEYELVERLRTGGGKQVMVSEAKILALDRNGRLEVKQAAEIPRRSIEANSAAMGMKLDVESGAGRFGGLAFRWRVERAGRGVPSKKGTRTEFFDADRLGLRIILRQWRAGDRMQPIGMASSVKLQDLFTNLKIPRGERHKLVILTTRSGEVVWVEGMRISERFKLQSGTTRRLRWQWKRL